MSGVLHRLGDYTIDPASRNQFPDTSTFDSWKPLACGRYEIAENSRPLRLDLPGVFAARRKAGDGEETLFRDDVLQRMIHVEGHAPQA